MNHRKKLKNAVFPWLLYFPLFSHHISFGVFRKILHFHFFLTFISFTHHTFLNSSPLFSFYLRVWRRYRWDNMMTKSMTIKWTMKGLDNKNLTFTGFIVFMIMMVHSRNYSRCSCDGYSWPFHLTIKTYFISYLY